MTHETHVREPTGSFDSIHLQTPRKMESDPIEGHLDLIARRIDIADRHGTMCSMAYMYAPLKSEVKPLFNGRKYLISKS